MEGRGADPSVIPVQIFREVGKAYLFFAPGGHVVNPKNQDGGSSMQGLHSDIINRDKNQSSVTT